MPLCKVVLISIYINIFIAFKTFTYLLRAMKCAKVNDYLLVEKRVFFIFLL